MKHLVFATLLMGAAAGALAAAPVATPAAGATRALPGDSVYQVTAPLSDQDGRQFTFDQMRGKPAVVSMFYNSCKFVCPMLIDTVRMTEEALSAKERDALSTLLLTFDPARDDVASLKAVATHRELDPKHWTLARTDAASVRKIAATLDIQYRQLSDGEYNHTTVLVLLDGEGRVVGRTKKMGVVDPAFVALIHSTLKAAAKRKG
jgi:protein SCO1/2